MVIKISFCSQCPFFSMEGLALALACGEKVHMCTLLPELSYHKDDSWKHTFTIHPECILRKDSVCIVSN